MAKANKHIQTPFDFNQLRIVKNMNCDKWHLQYDNGMNLPKSYNAPVYFDSQEEAHAFAEKNGIKLMKGKS